MKKIDNLKSKIVCIDKKFVDVKMSAKDVVDEISYDPFKSCIDDYRQHWGQIKWVSESVHKTLKSSKKINSLEVKSNVLIL